VRLRLVSLLLGAVTLAVAGCVPVQLRAPDPDARLAARAVELAGMPAWGFDGRLAVSIDGRAGTGRIDWRQDGASYVIQVRAPIAGESWQLSGDGDLAQLDGLGPEPRLGPDPDALLAREVGWSIPLAAIRDWVRGQPHGREARIRRDQAGRPTEIAEFGWRIEFRAWQDAANGFPEMPTRIIARRGGDDVRVSVTNWRLGSGD
jgi:outer membrane lipoprotein LolB